ADDGIRDKLVTGVQTCALPILSTSSVATHRQRSLSVITGVLCFILSLLFYYGAVVRVQFSRTDLLDLGPYPDAVEYFAQANSIRSEERRVGKKYRYCV